MGGIRHLEMPKERDGSLSQKIENKRSARFGLSTDRQVIISSGRGARWEQSHYPQMRTGMHLKKEIETKGNLALLDTFEIKVKSTMYCKSNLTTKQPKKILYM